MESRMLRILISSHICIQTYECTHILAAMMAWLCTFAWLISLLVFFFLLLVLSLIFGVRCLHRCWIAIFILQQDEKKNREYLDVGIIDWRQSMQLFKPADENYDITFWPLRCTLWWDSFDVAWRIKVWTTRSYSIADSNQLEYVQFRMLFRVHIIIHRLYFDAINVIRIQANRLWME